MVASAVIATSMTPARSQDASPKAMSDGESFSARAIERGVPTETTSMESSTLGTIFLEPYLGTLEGADFRARAVLLLPGAKIAIHAHDHPPAIVYVLENELVVHRNDSDSPVVRRRGDTYFEGPGVVHWLENVSADSVRAIAVDIVPKIAA